MGAVGSCRLRGRAVSTAEEAPKPDVTGVQSAIVVGPSGQEIHTDEFGRVRVQFPWDREGKNDDGSSCWIRTSQGWAGTGFGLINIPRICALSDDPSIGLDTIVGKAASFRAEGGFTFTPLGGARYAFTGYTT